MLDALEVLLPNNEHRFCVRHLHANFKSKGFKGLAFKDALWSAAMASNESQFKNCMEVIKAMDVAAFNYLDSINPKLWSRHAFSTHSCSDILTNNVAESFNAWVIEARDKPILTMAELIRRQLMNRFDQKRAGAKKSTNLRICPRIVKKLERNKTLSSDYMAGWRNNLSFEVDHMQEPRRVVHLDTKSCGCGRWQLNGIPCPHACSAIYENGEIPESYISSWYLMETYANSYAPEIHPMPGPTEWPVDDGAEPIEPPIIRKQRGRPKKLRKRGIDENDPTENINVTRRGYDITCGNCGQKGHNARSCKQPQNPNKKKWPKRVRSKNPTTSTAVSYCKPT